MILLYIFLAILISTVIIIALSIKFPHKTFLAKFVVLGIALSIGFGAFLLSMTAMAQSYQDIVMQDYSELMLYYPVVNNSQNEYVRYDYYNKVTLFNDNLRTLINNSENTWLGWLYDGDWKDTVHEINFQLNTGEENHSG